MTALAFRGRIPCFAIPEIHPVHFLKEEGVLLVNVVLPHCLGPASKIMLFPHFVTFVVNIIDCFPTHRWQLVPHPQQSTLFSMEICINEGRLLPGAVGSSRLAILQLGIKSSHFTVSWAGSLSWCLMLRGHRVSP